ncbi:MAG: RNA polymerase sigma factor [Polyangia bacterium]
MEAMQEKKGRLFLIGGSRPQAAENGDAELVSAFLRHEPGAAADIWERCYPKVRRTVFRMAGPGHDSEDLIQEIFLRLYRQLCRLRDPAALQPFVLAITVRVVKGDLRGRWVKRWLYLFHDGEIPEHEARGADLEARKALARFYRILDGLSPAHRAAFVLRQIEGLELTEVSAALGVSLATIKRWLPRILRRVHSQAKGDPLLAGYLGAEAGAGAGAGAGADRTRNQGEEAE